MGAHGEIFIFSYLQQQQYKCSRLFSGKRYVHLIKVKWGVPWTKKNNNNLPKTHIDHLLTLPGYVSNSF